MGWRVTVAVLAVMASLAFASSARAQNTYQVTGTADQLSPPPCQQIQPSIYTCSSLRGAVVAANDSDGADVIGPLLGTYDLNQQLSINDDLSLVGSGARVTTISPGGDTTRVMSIGSSASVSAVGLTIADGHVVSGAGGNIAIAQGSTLTLVFARVTGGIANQGGGILNEGTLNIGYSLLDNNSAQQIGGAIFNDGDLSNRPTVSLIDSTLANNYSAEGGGIYSAGNAANQILLSMSTIARNTGGGGLSFDGPQEVSMLGSIIAGNASGNCRGGQVASANWSVESGTDCGLAGASNRQGTDAGIAAALADAGGPTNVLTIPANSAAVDLVSTCFSGQDQRGYLRTPGEPCDAGAYDHAGVAQGDEPPVQTPVPTPVQTPVQTPVPTPSATPEPTPVANQSVVVREVSGAVKIRLKGTNKFVDLDATTDIPLGSEVDTKKGAIELTSVPKPGAPPEKAKFYDGIFKVDADGRDHGADVERAARAVHEEGQGGGRGGEAQEAQALGRGQGRVPHQRQVQRRDGPRHQVARGGLLRGHADQGHARRRHRPRQRAQEEQGVAGPEEVPGEAQVTKLILAALAALLLIAAPAQAET